MSYDTKCHEIAEWFMDDEPKALQTPANIARIAQRVQDVIEDEIECIKQDADEAIEAATYDYDESDETPDNWRTLGIEPLGRIQ